MNLALIQEHRLRESTEDTKMEMIWKWSENTGCIPRCDGTETRSEAVWEMTNEQREWRRSSRS